MGNSVMPETNDRNYYIARADAAKRLAERAIDPAIKDIHHQMMKGYESLARGPLAI